MKIQSVGMVAGSIMLDTVNPALDAPEREVPNGRLARTSEEAEKAELETADNIVSSTKKSPDTSSPKPSVKFNSV